MASFMQLDGGRELVNEEKAEALLKSITVTDATHIRLSNKSFDNGAAQKVSQYLESLSNVTHADISDIIAGRPEDEALRTVRIICDGLKKFDLIELNVSDNAFGGKGVEACRELLIKKKLERVYLCNNGLSAEACALVAEILLNDGLPPLKLLHFYNNMSGSGGASAVSQIVKQCATLEDFRFSATRSGNEGCLDIAKALGCLSKLKRIDLSDNNFGADASEALAEALKSQPDLEYLNLRDDGLSEEGVEFILSALSTAGSFPALSHLDLAGNEINEDLAKPLAKALRALSGLTHLALDDNELTSEGAEVLAKALASVKGLKTLSLTGCEITAKGAVAVARAVASLPSFVNLELNGNEICESGVNKIKAILKKAGKTLGEMEDNDEDGEDDLDEEQEEGDEEEDGDVKDLAEGIKNAAI